MKNLFLILFILLAAQSQAQELPMPLNIKKAYDKGTRSGTGKPGDKYWQNTADYHINIEFNPATRKLSGTVDITYTNNSPDSLKQAWFKLYPNYYKKGTGRSGNIDAEDLNDGVKISKMSIDGTDTDLKRVRIDGTNMTVSMKALGTGQKVKFSIAYNYELNKGSHMRTGQVDDNSAFVAYFFPRITVYDDVDGWNRNPYRGSEEFYNDNSTFKVNITVPNKYVVWATGDLKNASEVLQPGIVQRLQQAEQNDAIIDVISKQDLDAAKVTQDNNRNTWKFEALEVPDFAFATSDHYVWQAGSVVVDKTTGRRTRVDAAYNPVHKDFEEVAGFTRQTVDAMSNVFPKWPFPYSHETIFDGLDQMEYPMMANDNPLDDRKDVIMLTVHEVFHTMFPFYMGTNETKYAWMDEGWATIGEWLISPMIDSTIRNDYGILPYAISSGNEDDLPIATLTTQQTGAGNFINSYAKPAMAYLYVKELLGDELFTRALHQYINNWKGKHPIPYDFFNSMNAGAGRNLNWIWKAWFFDGGYPDLAISKATAAAGEIKITVDNKGGKPLPVHLKITYSDGSVQEVKRNIGVWEKGNKQTIVAVKTSKKPKKIELGSLHISDKNPKDNVFEVK